MHGVIRTNRVLEFPHEPSDLPTYIQAAFMGERSGTGEDSNQSEAYFWVKTSRIALRNDAVRVLRNALLSSMTLRSKVQGVLHLIDNMQIPVSSKGSCISEGNMEK